MNQLETTQNEMSTLRCVHDLLKYGEYDAAEQILDECNHEEFSPGIQMYYFLQKAKCLLFIFRESSNLDDLLNAQYFIKEIMSTAKRSGNKPRDPEYLKIRAHVHFKLSQELHDSSARGHHRAEAARLAEIGSQKYPEYTMFSWILTQNQANEEG
jgi:hypothetical protein